MIAIVHTYAPTPIMINIKPYYTFGRIKQLITKESGIKSCEQKLYWQHKIMHDKDIVKNCVMYHNRACVKNGIHFKLKINDF